MTEVRIPNRVEIYELPRTLLTQGWQDFQRITQIIGGTRLARSSVLCVPSAIIPQENNYVINPEHGDFRHIKFLAPEPFHFDSRLK